MLKFGSLHQIRKPAAFKRFVEGKPFLLCPCKESPLPPFSSAVKVYPEDIREYKEKAAYYAPDGIVPSVILWKGDVDKTAWTLLLTNFAWYNLGTGGGSYAHFYRDEEDDK